MRCGTLSYLAAFKALTEKNEKGFTAGNQDEVE